MKYISKDGTKIVEVLEITEDRYYRFITDGIETLVHEDRFLKVYQKLENEAKEM